MVRVHVAGSTKLRKKIGASVAYKTIGPFLSKVRRKDARGQSTKQSKGGCSAAVRSNHRQALVPGPNYQLHIEFTDERKCRDPLPRGPKPKMDWFARVQ